MSQSPDEQKILRQVGDRVKTLRQSLGVSQENLAERAGVHRTYIGMVERGEKNLTLISALKICIALDVSLSKLFEGINSEQ